MDLNQNLDDPSDIEEIYRIVFAVYDEIDPLQVEKFYDDAETDTELDEQVAQREDDSNSEQNGTEEEPDLHEKLFYLGKDKTTKWMKLPRKKGRTELHNIMMHEARRAVSTRISFFLKTF